MSETPNLSYREALSDGDDAFKHKILNIIKNEYILEREIYTKNLLSKDHIATADNVHKLKHKISILGLEKSYELAQEYEHQLREGKFNLKNKFEVTLSTIANFLKTI